MFKNILNGQIIPPHAVPATVCGKHCPQYTGISVCQ